MTYVARPCRRSPRVLLPGCCGGAGC
jgi:hypothetical protein